MSHVIVCGLGQVGHRVVTLLLELGVRVTLIAEGGREEWIRLAKHRGATVITGDARDEGVLETAGVKSAIAIIGCIEDDATNIEIALDSRRLAPNIRTVARIVDPGLAKQAEKYLGVHRAVSMTSAAAPTFAAATYGDHVLTEFTIGEERMFVLHVPGPHDLKEKPLATITDGGVSKGPEPSSLYHGERAVIVAEAIKMVGQLPKHPPKHRAFFRAMAPTAVFKFIRGVWKGSSPQLRGALLGIVGISLVSIAIFQIGMNLSTVDAIYFMVTTATTVGYGDFSPKEAPAWVKLFTCFMMVVSAAGMAVLFSMVTDYILTTRLAQLVGRHHVPERDHVIVAGVGTVGHRVVNELFHSHTPVVAIDNAESGEYLGALRSHIPVIIGDAREAATLHRAGILHAKAIIATTPSDAINLGIGLAAKEINPKIRLVLSIFDADFSNTVGLIPEVDAALSPPRLAAPAFVGAALYENAVASFRLDDHFFTLCEDAEGEVLLGGKKFSLEIQAISEKSI